MNKVNIKKEVQRDQDFGIKTNKNDTRIKWVVVRDEFKFAYKIAEYDFGVVGVKQNCVRYVMRRLIDIHHAVYRRAVGAPKSVEHHEKLKKAQGIKDRGDHQMFAQGIAVKFFFKIIDPS